ncbi:MAG: hypothetical protein Q7S71_01360 [Candidatus Nitrotoga sp.]|nr:hypothetical protein [Candidatus Nitrotoga sp.]
MFSHQPRLSFELIGEKSHAFAKDFINHYPPIRWQSRFAFAWAGYTGWKEVALCVSGAHTQ